MDPLSVTASIVSLAAVVRETVRLVQGIKDGGNDRIQIATEVKALLIVLRSVEGFCETADEDASAPWIQALRSISEDGGILECARSELQKLNGILEPKSGHQKLIQSVRWPLLDKAGIIRTLQHIIRLKQSMTSVLEQANTSMTQSILSDTKDLHNALQNDNIHAIMEWLSPLNMLAKQASLTKACGEGSGKWLLALPQFDFWKQSQKDIMWCPGIPGAGKTVMASIVAQHLQNASKDQNIGVFVLYISFNDPATQSIEKLLEALLKQIVQASKSLRPGVHELYQKHFAKQTRPSRIELITQIETALSTYTNIYIVVDALDEMLEENSRLDLLTTLWDLNGDAKFFVTSRLLPTIQQHLKPTLHMCDMCEKRSLKAFHRCLDCRDWDACVSCFSSERTMCVSGHKHMRQFCVSCIEISAKVEDLETYIHARIKTSGSLGSIIAKKPGLQQEIIDTVTRLAEERFLLAKFHMDTLANLHRPSQISKALKDLPSRIDETYDQAMLRIDASQQSREEAKALLRWVIHGYRPLHIREIEHATSVYPGQEEFDPDDIISADLLCSWCAGLVIIEAGLLRLVHYTAKDYFLTSGAHWFSDGSTLLGQACLTYLTINSSSSILTPDKDEITTHWGAAAGEAATFFESAQDYPFLEYASTYWAPHLLTSKDDDLQVMACDFLQKETNVTTVAMAYRCLGCGDTPVHELRYFGNDLFKGASALHLAGFWGLEAVKTTLLDNGSDVNARDEAGLTPLMYASLQGSIGGVKTLLHSGATVNTKCVANSTALHRAIMHGHEDVVETLLGCNDLDINIREGKTGFTPLRSAIFQRRHDIVGKLLAIKDLSSGEDCPPLIWAAYTGDAEIVKLLLRHSEDQLNSQDNLGRTALVNAARKDENADVIRVLLEAGANRDIADNDGNTPILEAVHNGFTANVRELISGDSLSLDQVHGSLIHVATRKDDHEVLRILLEHMNENKIDINAQDAERRTALHYTALQDSPLIALVLLEFGADTAVKDANGHSPIEVASRYLNITTYRILSEADDNVGEKLDTSFSRVEMHILEGSPSRKEPGLSALQTESTDNKAKIESKHLISIATTAPLEDVLVTSVACELKFDLDEEYDHFFQTRSALQYAFENGDPIIAQTLVDAEVDLNNYEENGDGPRYRLPLEMKVPKGLIRITEILAKHVARGRAKDATPSNSSATTLVNENGEWKVALFIVTFLAT